MENKDFLMYYPNNIQEMEMTIWNLAIFDVKT